MIDVRRAGGRGVSGTPAFHLCDVEIERGEDGEGLDERVRHVAKCNGTAVCVGRVLHSGALDRPTRCAVAKSVEQV